MISGNDSLAYSYQKNSPHSPEIAFFQQVKWNINKMQGVSGGLKMEEGGLRMENLKYWC